MFQSAASSSSPPPRPISSLVDAQKARYTSEVLSCAHQLFDELQKTGSAPLDLATAFDVWVENPATIPENSTNDRINTLRNRFINLSEDLDKLEVKKEDIKSLLPKISGDTSSEEKIEKENLAWKKTSLALHALGVDIDFTLHAIQDEISLNIYSEEDQINLGRLMDSVVKNSSTDISINLELLPDPLKTLCKRLTTDIDSYREFLELNTPKAKNASKRKKIEYLFRTVINSCKMIALFTRSESPTSSTSSSRSSSPSADSLIQRTPSDLTPPIAHLTVDREFHPTPSYARDAVCVDTPNCIFREDACYVRKTANGWFISIMILDQSPGLLDSKIGFENSTVKHPCFVVEAELTDDLDLRNTTFYKSEVKVSEENCYSMNSKEDLGDLDTLFSNIDFIKNAQKKGEETEGVLSSAVVPRVLSENLRAQGISYLTSFVYTLSSLIASSEPDLPNMQWAIENDFSVMAFKNAFSVWDQIVHYQNPTPTNELMDLKPQKIKEKRSQAPFQESIGFENTKTFMDSVIRKNLQLTMGDTLPPEATPTPQVDGANPFGAI